MSNDQLSIPRKKDLSGILLSKPW